MQSDLIRAKSRGHPTVGTVEVGVVRQWGRAAGRVGAAVRSTCHSFPLVFRTNPHRVGTRLGKFKDILGGHGEDREPAPALRAVVRSSAVNNGSVGLARVPLASVVEDKLPLGVGLPPKREAAKV